jgi:hypothetical protein
MTLGSDVIFGIIYATSFMAEEVSPLIYKSEVEVRITEVD